MISNDAFNAIEALDFSPIKLKLMHKSFGEGWTQSKADAMEKEYRRFLYLQAAFPGEQTAPTLDVDTFWHHHILDTMKYAADCDQAFGHFLHHYPYLGMMEDDEPDVEVEAGNRTRELYEATFGEAYIRAEAYADEDGAAEAARCQGLCIVGKPLKGGASARCQGLCIVGKPAGKGHASARWTGVCTVARPATSYASARWTGICTVARPAAQGHAVARCNAVCTVANPEAMLAKNAMSSQDRRAAPSAGS